MLAINLERHPDDMVTVDQVRQTFQELWMSSVKLELTPISESLQDTIKGLDLLLDWQVYPTGMTDFVLLLIDRLLTLAHEVEAKHYIDMRKTQQILVALQYIILAKSVAEITQGIEDAVASLSQEISELPEQDDQSTGCDLFGDEVELFDDGDKGVDLFDDGVDLFDNDAETTANDHHQAVDLFIPEVSQNPLYQAKDYIKCHSTENCLILLGQISDKATQHHQSHTSFLLELSLAVNFMAGTPLSPDNLYKGICLHDIALASVPELLTGGRKKTEQEIAELRLHPVKGAELARAIPDSEETSLLVLHHHERIDGSGYPYGLKGDNISEQGKLAAIVDSFHDVIEQRSRFSEREQVLKAIFEINRQIGIKYDASWVNMFNAFLRNYWLQDWRDARADRMKKAG